MPLVPRYFRKRPVIVKAFYYDGEPQTRQALRRLYPSLRLPVQNLSTEGKLVIPSLEGDIFLSPGDWLIEGLKGELYPCRGDIFLLTYEEVFDVH